VTNTMTPTSSPRELDHRAHDGLEVTLFWYPSTNALKICVCDTRAGAYVEVEPDPRLALDAFKHPYSYASCSDAYWDEGLAA
jgi:hypothetical protein